MGPYKHMGPAWALEESVGPARALEEWEKFWEHTFFKCIFMKQMSFFVYRQRFFMVLTCSWIFWPKNDTERIWNYLKKQVLDPKHVKFAEKSGSGGTLDGHRQSQPLELLYKNPLEIPKGIPSYWTSPPTSLRSARNLLSLSKTTDCYLRQGDGGTKTARFASSTCFLR